jgi:hypothetical protein
VPKGSITYVTLSGTKELRQAANFLRHDTQKTAAEFVRWRAGVVTKDLIDFTPPRGPHPAAEGWKEQKERGDRAVERDIKKVFRNGADLWDILKLHPLVQRHANLARILIKYINNGDYLNLSRVLYKIGSRIVLIPQPLREQHFAERNPSNGRVFRKPRHHYYVLQDRKIQGYITLIQRDVGKMKHGWMKAARTLEVKDIPHWVKRQQSEEGDCIDDSNRRGNPSVTISSNAKGADRLGPIVAAVIEINQSKMLEEYRIRLAHDIRKHRLHHV